MEREWNQMTGSDTGDIPQKNEKCYQEIAELIRRHEQITILTHQSMDGDTLGSALALAFAISSQDTNKESGKSVTIVADERVPDSLSFLPGLDYLTDFTLRNPGLVIVLDTADLSMLGRRRALLEHAVCVINIDHHFTNMQYGSINLVEDGYAATAEVIYYLIQQLGAKQSFEIATCLYAAICTDTGGFKYRNTSAQTHEIAAKLMVFPLNVAEMNFRFFDEMSRTKLCSMRAVVENLKFYFDGKLAITVITTDIFKNTGASPEDCEGLVNIGRSVRGTEVSILAKEVNSGEFRVSFRSQGKVDVAALAQVYGGGGHKAAAGCTLRIPETEMSGTDAVDNIGEALENILVDGIRHAFEGGVI